MSWRAGGKLFWDIWPQVKDAIPDAEFRTDFTRSLVRLFLDYDVDPCEMEGDNAEIDQIMNELNSEE